MEKLLQESQQLALPLIVNLGGAIIILVVGIWLAGRLSHLVRRGMELRQVDPTITKFVGRLVYYLLVAFVVVAVLGRMGVQTASIIAVLGAAGLAVGLALQGSLSNLASGLLLILFRPCRVGDFVDVAGVTGTVDSITMFSTVVVTVDNKVITVPNTAVISGAIVNYTALPERRVDLLIAIAYGADLKRAKDELMAVAQADSRILKNRDITIAVAELAAASVNLTVRVWVSTADYWTVLFDLNERIKLRLEEAGIARPVPRMDVNLPGKA